MKIRKDSLFVYVKVLDHSFIPKLTYLFVKMPNSRFKYELTGQQKKLVSSIFRWLVVRVAVCMQRFCRI